MCSSDLLPAGTAPGSPYLSTEVDDAKDPERDEELDVDLESTDPDRDEETRTGPVASASSVG